MEKLNLEDCWAKTDPETGKPFLSVKNHCAIVGTVAKTLFKRLPRGVKEQLPKGATTLVAAHDLGKLTPGFQIKALKWEWRDAVIQTINANGLETNHAVISQWHLQNYASFKTNRKSQFWLLSTRGHHGSYLKQFRPLYQIPNESGNTRFAELRDELLEQLIQHFGALPEEAAKNEDERIHLLTGFTIFSDWIGSNADWFNQASTNGLDSLVATTNEVLDKLHWNPRIRNDKMFGQLFMTEKQESFQPREIQIALLESAQSPGLYIVEAPMGMGKTEAALAAAYQRWTKGEARGLYFALPTQLTSTRIHDRVNNFLENILDAASFQPLIHGNAWLDGKDRHPLSPTFIEIDHERPEQDENDISEALRWYSTTRRQLIAPFGTGTIDQALLAILPARFAALRYFALAGKVVIIDEVHSFDPYMSALIDRLIRFLIKAGSTVIILSATLTARRRAELVKAAGAEEAETPSNYPLITKVVTGSPFAVHIKLSGILDKKFVHLKHETLEDDNSEADFWESIARQVEAGANVVIIRNTVALAQHTYCCLKSRLSSRIEADRIGLLHSRFPQDVRRENEENWTEVLGKDKTQRPKGSLLVATQIVEQSVDIDADYLVTDLAPVDLILQRIGRLHRHPHERPVGFETAICHIIHPNINWQVSLKDVKQALKPHHHIYPALSLWQSAEILSNLKTISLPDDIRSLLEKASALSPSPSSPAALVAFAADYAHERDKMLNTAKVRNISNAEDIEDKEGTETRYGIIPTAQLVILSDAPIWQGEQVHLQLPDGSEQTVRVGEFSYPLAKALHEIATRIPAYLVKPQLRDAPDWLLQHIDDGVIAIRSDDSTELSLYASQEMPYRLYYRNDLGVWYEKNETIPTPEEPEDFWY